MRDRQCEPRSESRRSVLVAAALLAAPVYALAREARAADTLTDSRLPARRWVMRQDELARALRAGSISHVSWHDEVNRLAAEVDVAQLMAETMQTPSGTPFMRDPIRRNVHFLDENGQPMRLSYGAATFSFGPGNVITPHAHKHMASAHMVVKGRVRIRTFDRVGHEGGALIIRPTSDHIGEVGAGAAMTSERDNVHWFTPASLSAMTFDVIVDGLDKGQEAYVIQPIDPLGGRHRPDGTIVAPVLSFQESMERYSGGV